MVSLASLGANSSGYSDYNRTIVNPQAGFHMYQPKWDSATVFVPHPEPTADRTGILPFVDSDNPDSLSEWVRILPKCVRGTGMGDSRITFNSELPEGSPTYSTTPYEHLLSTVRGMENDPHGAFIANQLLKGGPGRGAAMPPPKCHAFLQGTLYARGTNDYMSDPRRNVAFLLPTSALTSLHSLIVRAFTELNITSFYDPQNKFALHFQRAFTSPILPAGCEEVLISDDADRNPQTDATKNHYTIRLIKLPAHVPYPDLPTVLNSWCEWQDLVVYMTVEQQMSHLATIYKDIDSKMLMRRAFLNSEFGQYLPPWVLEDEVVVQAAPVQQAPPPGQPFANPVIPQATQVQQAAPAPVAQPVVTQPAPAPMPQPMAQPAAQPVAQPVQQAPTMQAPPTLTAPAMVSEGTLPQPVAQPAVVNTDQMANSMQTLESLKAQISRDTSTDSPLP